MMLPHPRPLRSPGPNVTHFTLLRVTQLPLDDPGSRCWQHFWACGQFPSFIVYYCGLRARPCKLCHKAFSHCSSSIHCFLFPVLATQYLSLVFIFSCLVSELVVYLLACLPYGLPPPCPDPEHLLRARGQTLFIIILVACNSTDV